MKGKLESVPSRTMVSLYRTIRMDLDTVVFQLTAPCREMRSFFRLYFARNGC